MLRYGLGHRLRHGLGYGFRYIYSVRLTRKLRYSAQPVTGALSKQLNYLVAVTYVSVS